MKKREIELDRPRILYRVEEAAELLSLSRDRIYQLIRSNQLRTVVVGKSRRVPARSLGRVRRSVAAGECRQWQRA